jgi:hypothetical protein
MVVCESVPTTPSPKSLGQGVHMQRKVSIKHFPNGTSRIYSIPVASQWSQYPRIQRNGTRHLSDSTHTDTKRSLQLRAGNKAVSRNITTVLDNLLKNYESSQPPNNGKGKVTTSYLFSPCKWCSGPQSVVIFKKVSRYILPSIPSLSYHKWSSN